MRGDLQLPYADSSTYDRPGDLSGDPPRSLYIESYSTDNFQVFLIEQSATAFPVVKGGEIHRLDRENRSARVVGWGASSGR